MPRNTNRKKDILKEAMFEEYRALREEILKRIGGQGVAFAATVALVGAFIGVNYQFSTGQVGHERSLLLSVISSSPDVEALGAFCVLTVGFTLGVELLLSFWIYQTHMIFRIHYYLSERVRQFAKTEGISPEELMFDWGAIPNQIKPLWHDTKGMVRKGIQIGLTLQPVMLFALCAFGITLTFMSLPSIWSDKFSMVTAVGITGAAFILLGGLILLFHIHLSFHVAVGADIYGRQRQQLLRAWKWIRWR